MYYLLYLVLLAGTVYTMQRHGFGRTFAWCLLPAVLLVNFSKSVTMPLLPNLTSVSIVFYGVMIGLIFRWRELGRLRWNAIDTCMTLILVPIFVTTFMNGALDPASPINAPTLLPGSLKLAQRYTMEFGVNWLFPYFMARMTLQDGAGRKAMLNVLCALSIFMALLTVVESSGLRPNITARTLYRFQLNTTSVGRPDSMVFKRFGLARAIATAGQQIDLGNVGVLVGTMILILIPATDSRWTSPLSVGGILGAGAMVVGSVSLTSWAGMVVAFGCYFLFTRPRLGRYFIVPILLAEFAFMLLQSYSMLNADLGERPEDGGAGDSKWIRVKIIQDAWPVASSAGLFGYGYGVDTRHIGIGSVDNSYLLFVLQVGWLGLLVWVLLLVVVIFKAAKAMSRVQTSTERLPLAAMTGGVLAITFSMYTVFFGFCYAILFGCVIGLLSSMSQMLAGQRAAAVSLHGGAMPHGFPVAMSGPMR